MSELPNTDQVIEIDEHGRVHAPAPPEAPAAALPKVLRDRDALFCRALVATLDPREIQRVTTEFNRLRDADPSLDRLPKPEAPAAGAEPKLPAELHSALQAHGKDADLATLAEAHRRVRAAWPALYARLKREWGAEREQPAAELEAALHETIERAGAAAARLRGLRVRVEARVINVLLREGPGARAERPAATAEPIGGGHLGEMAVCPDCGSGVGIDEDGCCTSCGADTTSVACRWVPVAPDAPPRAEPAEAVEGKLNELADDGGCIDAHRDDLVAAVLRALAPWSLAAAARERELLAVVELAASRNTNCDHAQAHRSLRDVVRAAKAALVRPASINAEALANLLRLPGEMSCLDDAAELRARLRACGLEAEG